MINPKTKFQLYTPMAPLGVLAIASYLQQHNYQMRVYDRTVDKVSLEEVMQEFSPHVVGVSVTTFLHIQDSIAVSRTVRDATIPVVWGGAMSTCIANQIVLEQATDYVVLSEGEITFHELLQAIEHNAPTHDIAGLVYLDQNGEPRQTTQRVFADLHDFPPTDWSLVNAQQYIGRYLSFNKMISMYGSKGCPRKCSYCFNEQYNRCQYRKRPNEQLIKEIKQLAANYDFDTIRFQDELFCANKADLHDFCHRFRALELPVQWLCFRIAGATAREELQLMYDSGCRGILYGLESGSPQVLKRMRRNIALDKIEQEIAWCKEIGIEPICGFILGSPDETCEELKETAQLMKRIDIRYYSVSQFFPIPGSKFYRDLTQQGKLAPKQTLQGWCKEPYIYFGAQVNYSQVPVRHLHVVQNYFNWRSFWGTKTRKEKNTALAFIITTIQQMFERGVSSFIRYGLISAKIFFKVAWYRFAYPKILREYGLK